MSRIGKKPILIPKEVTVTVNASSVEVKGPKGVLNMKVRPEIKVVVEGDKVLTSIERDTKRSSAYWGLTSSVLSNMIVGVTRGYEKKLELSGVGYRAKQEGKDGVSLSVGYSRPVVYRAFGGVEIEVVDQQNITVRGIDKQLVGLVAANIRKVRKPEPYKGKGIKYVGEVIRRKVGKSGKV